MGISFFRNLKTIKRENEYEVLIEFDFKGNRYKLKKKYTAIVI